MTDQWYCAENGKSVGPLSTQEVADRLGRADGKPYLVWSPGMAEWVDARSLPQFAPRAASAAPSSEPAKKRPGEAKPQTLASRARHELIAYIAVSGYLMVWFSAVMFYKATILRSVGIEFAPLGIAAVKALILGKFILVLEAVKLGERKEGDILLVQIVKKALLFTVALVILTIIEELIVGHFHGKGAREVLSEIGGGTPAQAVAASLLMFLVLLPYLAFRRIAQETGDLPELLFARRSFTRKG
jgi:hypothetical protein